MPVYLYIVMMCGFSILFIRDFNIVFFCISFHISYFSFLFSFSSGFLSSSRSRERLPNHFRSRFSFVHENNTDSNLETHSFSVVGPTTWNELPIDLKHLPNGAYSQFHHLLKTLLFCLAWVGSASE